MKNGPKQQRRSSQGRALRCEALEDRRMLNADPGFGIVDFQPSQQLLTTGTLQPAHVATEFNSVTTAHPHGFPASPDGGGGSGATPTLRVTDFEWNASGFHVEFSEAIDRSVLNLYDTQTGGLGQADVLLVGDAVGSVDGSILVDGNHLVFVATGGVLAADNYTVTLRSAASGIKSDLTDERLDGEWPGTDPGFPSGNGVSGGNFVYTFTVAAPVGAAPVIVSLPDFARGPGQWVDAPAYDGAAFLEGLPIWFSDATGVEAFELTIAYDPSLLTITGAHLGIDAPPTSNLAVNTSLPGQITLLFDSPIPLFAGLANLVTLDAVVPASAEYGAANLLDITNIQINEGAITAIGDDAVHVAAYTGDATGDGTYSALDSQRINRVFLGLDSGFAAYPTIDPTILGDVTGNGSLSVFDAQEVQAEVIDLDSPYIPAIPTLENAPPIAHNQSITIAEDTAILIQLMGDDGDPEAAQTLTFAITSDPANGVLSDFDPIAGTVLYTPNANYNGPDSFQFTVTDDASAGEPFSLESASATVSITLTPVNDAPVADSETYTVLPNTPLTIFLFADDGDPLPGESQVLTYFIEDGPLHGTAVLIDNQTGEVLYTPDTGYLGPDSFTFGVFDDNTAGPTPGLMSPIATISLTIDAVDTEPDAVDDEEMVDEGGSLAGDVLSNDTGLDNVPVNVTLVAGSGPQFAASFTLNPDGSYDYVHDGSENFTDSFSYRVEDSDGDFDTATVFITITPINDNGPVGVNDAIEVDEGGTATALVGGATSVLDNDTDDDLPNDVLTVNTTPVVGPMYGTLTLNADGSFTYEHDGSENFTDSFEYEVSDALGATSTAVVTISISPVNDNAPMAVGDSVEVDEGGTATMLVGGESSVLHNDTDVDLPNDVLTVNTTPVTGVQHGTLVLNSDGTFSYEHDGSDTTSDSFVYEIMDAAGNTSTATVNIAITSANSPPVNHVPTELIELALGQPLVFDPPISVSDPDVGAGELRVTITTSHVTTSITQITGTVSAINAALASMVVTLQPGYVGEAWIEITTDDMGATGTGGPMSDVDRINILISVPMAFDFGTASSPVETGYTAITPTSAYSALVGYGWTSGDIRAADRATGSNLNRDLNYTVSGVFSVDLAPGFYDVIVYLGDMGSFAHDEMLVIVEDVNAGIFSTAAGEVIAVQVPGVEVIDGRLSIHFQDLEGVDANVAIAGIEIAHSSVEDESGAAAVADATVALPAEVIGRPGEIITIPIMVDQSLDLRAAGVTGFHFDPSFLSLVEVVGVRAGTIWPAASTVVGYNIDATTGTITASVFNSLGVINGSGTLIEFDFRISDSAPVGGSTIISIDQVELNETMFASIANGSVVIAAANNADFDGDGDVDGDDFLLWQTGFGMESGATQFDGDGDNDGDVDADDLSLWQDQFGAPDSSGSGSAAMPDNASGVPIALRNSVATVNHSQPIVETRLEPTAGLAAAPVVPVAQSSDRGPIAPSRADVNRQTVAAPSNANDLVFVDWSVRDTSNSHARTIVSQTISDPTPQPERQLDARSQNEIVVGDLVGTKRSIDPRQSASKPMKLDARAVAVDEVFASLNRARRMLK